MRELSAKTWMVGVLGLFLGLNLLGINWGLPGRLDADTELATKREGLSRRSTQGTISAWGGGGPLSPTRTVVSRRCACTLLGMHLTLISP